MMTDPFARLWWLLALRGLAGILFGALAVLWPFFTLEALLFAFGVYAMADGAAAFYAGVERYERGYPWWPFAIEGVLGVLLGALVIAFPDRGGFLLWYLVAGWALATGAFEIVAAARLRRHTEGETLLFGAGVCSLAFGVLMFCWPRAAVLALAWSIGLYAALFGLLLLMLAVRLRRALRSAAAPARPEAPTHAGAA
jgi:uncharacterized membrane protein HdeD (DUF308 family)